MANPRNDSDALAEKISDLASEAGRSIATAESLTGGQISCLLGAAPGSSDWFRGAIVAYASAVKHDLLEVPPGPVVSEAAARSMAAKTAELLGADTVIAVTGAAGPDGQDGQEPGTVWFGIFDRGSVRAFQKKFEGEPTEVVETTAHHALELLTDCLGGE
ncbi:CinA family protein [Prescottella equi]|uniref:CinA family protein n=1 Tax=Rhodococcus hoagii TaxID=43767 RepID=UPI001DCD57A0|nr:nicotinamide-nucleotide amidohydrolase family protein [Prescottella equi]MBM4484946.1 nicotinamide-nucleotide amidohydrolase family protein [Prescottella equi]MBM4518963.1 nicotinamide-nucleotide amidohydrolase family protein [Prescottella equi]MBM4530747.1 nicotinamide-nucleotide amidohydrolase family protein [Prescottella equi]MBM4530760.1 nicotinamide-nucleotide amidohydrolase family protein [Prescottella equi]